MSDGAHRWKVRTVRDPAGDLLPIGLGHILRWQLTRCSSSKMSPTAYTKINCFDVARLEEGVHCGAAHAERDCCIEGIRRPACSSAYAASAVFVRSSRRDQRSRASSSRGR